MAVACEIGCWVYDFCFWDSVGGLGVHNEVTDDFSEVTDLNLDVPEESISGPSPNDNDRRKRYLANTDQSEWVPTSLCEILRHFSPKESVPYIHVLMFI